MRCGNCKESHETVQDVRNCYFDPSVPDKKKPATEKQLNYAHGLLRQREAFGVVHDIEMSNSLEAAHEYVSTMDFDQVKGFISTMVDQPKRSEKANALKPLVGEGLYQRDGQIYKVQVAVHGSGHLYCKRLEDVEGSRRFVYAPGMLTALRPEDVMTLKEAAEFGKLYGFCVRCGRTLTDEASIEAGIGPICASKMAI